MRVSNSGLKVRLALLKVGLGGTEFGFEDIARAAGVPGDQARHYLKPSNNRYADKVGEKLGRGRPSGIFKLSSSGRLSLVRELSAISPDLVPGGIFMQRFILSLSELEVAVESIRLGTALNVKETVRFAAGALRSARRALARISGPDAAAEAEELLESALKAFRGLPVEQSLLMEDKYFPTPDSLSDRKAVSVDDAFIALSVLTVNPSASDALLIVESIVKWVVRLESSLAAHKAWSAFIHELSKSLAQGFPEQANELENIRKYLAIRINRMQLDNLPSGSTIHMAAKKHPKKTDETGTTLLKKKSVRKTQFPAGKARGRIPAEKTTVLLPLAAKRRALERVRSNKRRRSDSARTTKQNLELASGRR